MSVFSIGIMLNFQSLVVYFKNIYLTIESPNKQWYLRCKYTKFQLKIRYVLNLQRVPIVLSIYYRNDRERNGRLTEMCEALLKMYQI